MQILGIRFCAVSDDAEPLAKMFDGLGLERMNTGGKDDEKFTGSIFPAGNSWIEIWPDGPEMPVGIMLQLVVDDADAFAENAKKDGFEPTGPMDAHGERIYYLMGPSGLQMSFQSRLEQ